MDQDDVPLGRLLNRRELLALLGASGAMLATGTHLAGSRGRNGPAFPSCVVRPEQTEGPYFVDERLNRSDIRSDPGSGKVSPGTPLALAFLVSHVAKGICQPLAGAQVDVWHCDATGHYSDVNDPSGDLTGQKFLRGYQITDAAGRATFQTIYPGWYPGRAVHIHFKIRTPAPASRAAEFTSQVYFEDGFSDQVYRGAPYVSKGDGRVRNAADGIFRQGGDRLLLTPEPAGNGYQASFALGMQLG